MTITACANSLDIMETSKKSSSSIRQKLRQKIEGMQSKRKPTKEKPESSVPSRVKEKPQKKKRTNTLSVADKAASNKKKPVSNNGEPSQIFNRFNFMESKELQNDKRKIGNAKLLAIAEKRKEKLATIRESNPDTARSLEAKQAWQRAMDKAKGIKVKDDPKVLKKVIKKERSMKRRSTKKWADRQKQESDKQAERQAKRQRNLDKVKAT